MPLYEYQCPTCGRFEVIRKFSDSPLEECPTCGKPITKLFSAPAIQFKGAGWYVTDYAKKSTNGEKSGDASSKDSNSKDSKDSSSSSKESTGSSSTPSASSSKDTSAPSTTSSTTSSASGSSPSK